MGIKNSPGTLKVSILKPHAVVAVIVGFCMTHALFLLQRAVVFVATTGFK